MVRALTTVIVLALLATTNEAGEVKIALTGDNAKVTFVGTKPGGRHEGEMAGDHESSRLAPAYRNASSSLALAASSGKAS